MEAITLPKLHAKMLQAEAEGHAAEQLRYATEAVRIEPTDHRGRASLGRALAGLGRVSEGVSVLRAAALQQRRAGFFISAMATLKTAMSSSADEPGLADELRALHDRIADAGFRLRGTVPPPPPPPSHIVPPPKEGDSALDLDGAELIARAVELGRELPSADDEAPGAHVPLFSDVSRESFVSLLRQVELSRVDAGTVLMEEGAPGNSLLVIVSGRVEVSREEGAKPNVLARLGPGALIGEMALMTSQPRTATVRAVEPTEVLRIRNQDIETVAQDHPAIAEELVRFARRRLIINVLQTSPIFLPFDREQRLEVLKAFSSRVVPEGETIIEEGREPEGLFVVASGEIKVFKTDEDGEPVVLAHLRPGDVLGEIALVEDSLTTASALAVTKSVLLFLERSMFRQLVDSSEELARYLEGLSGERLREARAALEGEVIDADDLIII